MYFFPFFLGKVEVYLNPDLYAILSQAISHHWIKGWVFFSVKIMINSYYFFTLHQLLI